MRGVAVARFRPSLTLICLAALASALLACSESRSVTVTREPELARTDVIEAVRRGVAGKTYSETVYEQVEDSWRCSQIDVDLDPYMPRNPELAKCSHVGDTYTVWESVASEELRSCPAAPDAEDPGWYVQALADDQWRVSHGSSRWTVTKLAGGWVGAEGVVTVSSYQFGIKADSEVLVTRVLAHDKGRP